VFADEAHRTQSGKLDSAMKKLMPGAMFIGFTGTPLLKADKATSIETFGRFIHTYKFDDGVGLDLARTPNPSSTHHVESAPEPIRAPPEQNSAAARSAWHCR
jgi:hypothetical protein